ncbi:MAG: caspase domain-containing protein [Reyranella sp.]
MALLVGNAHYSQSALSNPVNDVRLVGNALRGLGFTATILEDADKPTFHGAVIDFCTRLEQAGSGSVALFYYAGHGIQHEGTNYVLPVNASIPSSRHLPAGALRVDEIVAELARMPRKANVIVLDACRNNPLPNMAVSSRDVTQGLAALKLPAEGMLVVYSTAAGEVAEDGDSDRSPYATALVEVLPGLLERGRRIHDVFVEAADRVHQATAGKQNPALYMHGSLPPLVAVERKEARHEAVDKPVSDGGIDKPAVREGEIGKPAVAGDTIGAVPAPRPGPPARRRPWRKLVIGASGIPLFVGALSLAWYGWVHYSSALLGTVSGDAPEQARQDLGTLLASEFPATATPLGYSFRHVEPFCCSEEEEKRLGIERYARVYFIRDGLPQKPNTWFSTWEGLNYIVFTDADHASRYTLANLDSLNLMKMMLGDDDEIAKKFNERAWRGTITVPISSPSGPPQQLPCYVADTLIGCLVRPPNPRVVYQLLLQEPKLRDARTDEGRQNLVKARVQKETGLLMRAAEEHINWARRTAGY